VNESLTEKRSQTVSLRNSGCTSRDNILVVVVVEVVVVVVLEAVAKAKGSEHKAQADREARSSELSVRTSVI